MPREPEYQRIRADLRRRIAAGDWPDGELPRQVDLAEEYGVSLQPIKFALMYLEFDGFIERRQGLRAVIVRREVSGADDGTS